MMADTAAGMMTSPSQSAGIRQPVAQRHSLEDAIADFLVGFDAASVTDFVRAATRRLIQDQLGNQIACAGLPWSVQTMAFVRAQMRPGKASIAVTGETMSAVDAAFANSTLGHGFEYDDAHRESASHPGACVVPAALALGEETGATVDDMIAALVAGYEVYTRIGSIAAPDLLSRGFHPHCVLSTFGAAAVAVKLLGLTREQAGHALAIASSHASGFTEYSSSGGSVKRVHSGIGTAGGIRAAQMAAHGITGPTSYLTGSKGFYRTFIGRDAAPDAARRFAPDRPFEIDKVWIKPYLCCGCIHSYIDAVRPFAGRVDDIDYIDVRLQRSANIPVGTKNESAYAPLTIEQVQYSLPVQLALTLLGMGNGYQVHLEAMKGKLDLSPNGAILKTAGLVRMTEDAELDLRYPGKFIADVTIAFRDGSSEHILVEDSTGTIENPMSQSDLDAKFRELTSNVLGPDRSDRLLGAVKTLGGLGGISALTALMKA